MAMECLNELARLRPWLLNIFLPLQKKKKCQSIRALQHISIHTAQPQKHSKQALQITRWH